MTGKTTAAKALAERIEKAEDEALKKASLKRAKDKQLTLFDVAPWPDHMRGMPNDIARSAIFTVRSKKTPRENLENEVIFSVMKDLKITYTGTELRAYDDEIVWLQVMEYAKRVPIGDPITFTFYEMCKDLGWPINGKYYEHVEECLTRLQTTALKFISKRIGLESLSLIRRFGFTNNGSKRKCQVFLEDEIAAMFAGDHYSKLVWDKYKTLSSITRRMFDYFSTHREPYPLTLENFRHMCKSESKRPSKWREQVKNACAELTDSGLVRQAYIEGNNIRCERALSVETPA
jgi:hypothetical protein